MSLTAITIGSNDYASYASVAEADVVLAVDPSRGARWAALDADAKGRNLIAATNRLDLLRWAGERHDVGGAVQTDTNGWPRSGLTFADGSAVDDETIPTAVERATILLAGSIAIDGDHASATPAAVALPVGIRKVRAGTVEIERDTSVSDAAAAEAEAAARGHAPLLADRDALALVSQWLATGRTSAGARVAGGASFGTDASSAFDDPDRYDTVRGYS